jgi:hypothetical protein
MTRLRLVSRHLLRELRSASDERRRRVAFVACEYVVTRTALRIPVIERALEALCRSDRNGLPALTELELVKNQFDREYADLYECYGDADESKWHGAFCKMVAAEAVCYACHEDSLTAASETAFNAFVIEKNLDGAGAANVQHMLETALRPGAGPDTSK